MLKIKFQKFFFQNFHSFFLFFILRAFNFFTYEWKIYTRAFIIQKWKLLEMKNKKTTWVFFLLKYSKFWSASHLFWRCVIWWTNIGWWEPFFNTDSTHSLSATYIHTSSINDADEALIIIGLLWPSALLGLVGWGSRLTTGYDVSRVNSIKISLKGFFLMVELVVW